MLKSRSASFPMVALFVLSSVTAMRGRERFFHQLGSWVSRPHSSYMGMSRRNS